MDLDALEATLAGLKRTTAAGSGRRVASEVVRLVAPQKIADVISALEAQP